MTLGAPAALWGLLAIPLLILLYLLRVRRRDHPVSSVLLWQRSAPTLAAYRPSRRIERSLLLLLQILATAAVVTALARPSLVVRGPDRGDVMLVMDLSLSMRARDVSPSRFDRARAEALDVVTHLRPGQRSGIVVASLRPQLLVPLTDDRARVTAALRSLEPWDVAADVRGAVLMAADYPAGATGQVRVWTDAARGGLPAASRVTYRIVGTSDDNVGITAFRIARDPRGAEAFLRVDNFGHHSRQVPIAVTHERETVYHNTVDVPAGGNRTVVFPVSGMGEFRARLDVHDALPDDDVASAVLDPAPLPSVLLVTEGNPYLERVLQILPVSRAAATRSTDPSVWASYGVVILDRITPGRLPPGDYLLIASVPPNLPITATGDVSRPEVTVWDRTDPVLQFVDLGAVRISRAMALTTAGGRVLAGGDVPLLWAYEGGGVRALVMGFALQDSDLPQRVAFPVLIANSLAWLGGEAAVIRAGEPVQFPSGGGASAELAGPTGRHEVRAESGMFSLPPLTRAGVYQLKTPGGTRMITVRPADPIAGIIRPGGPPDLAPQGAGPAGAPGAGEGAAGRGPVANRPLLARLSLWPWLVLSAIGAACLEWALATRRRGGDA
jgi:Ca-activated chloride channel homolog